MGIILGLLLASLALTPSLVPRPTVFQGALAGIWFAVGYGIGTLIHTLGSCPWGSLEPVRQFLRRPVTWLRGLGSRRKTLRRIILLVLSGAYVIGYGALVVHWQNDVRTLVEMEPVSVAQHTEFLLAMALTAVLCLGIGNAIGWLRRSVQSRAARKGRSTPAMRGWVAGTGAVIGLLAVLVVAAVVVVDQSYGALNRQTAAGLEEPASDFRSAGTGSAISWDGLGAHGRGFVGGGPDAGDIARLTGKPAKEPVRVYAGLGNADTLAERAALAVAELKRTGAFEREVLVVATTTGSGWLEAQATESLEYLYLGDTAIVTMQYSYLPSWVSFLFNEELPVEASRALFDAVHTEWLTLPEDQRPRLAVYGLSLGAFGMQAALGDVSEIRSQVDAALFTGPPNNSEPWRTLQENRDAGSPVWQPVYRGGKQVRWMSTPGDFQRLDGAWEEPRLAYLQHATDAITWLDHRVIYQRPEWLAGSRAEGGRAADVSDSMLWIPGVTWMQLVADMLLSESVPAGHGHNYGDVMVDGWANVLPGHGLDSAVIDRIQASIEELGQQNPEMEIPR